MCNKYYIYIKQKLNLLTESYVTHLNKIADHIQPKLNLNLNHWSLYD